MSGVSGERFVEHVESASDDDPENDLGGDALLLDDLFVEAFVAVFAGVFVAHV